MKTPTDIPSPFTGGKMELCVEESSTVFRGEKISFKKSFYHCLDSGAEFANEEMEASNLKNIYDTYRRKHGIPLAEELSSIRKIYGIPARAFSLILGLGENQFRLYEEGTVPTVSVGRLLSLASDPRNMKKMLIAARADLSDKDYAKYYKAIDSAMPPATFTISSGHKDGYESFPSILPTSSIHKKTSSTSSKRVMFNQYIHSHAV